MYLPEVRSPDNDFSERLLRPALLVQQQRVEEKILKLKERSM